MIIYIIYNNNNNNNNNIYNIYIIIIYIIIIYIYIIYIYNNNIYCHHANFDICGKLCLSIAGLKSHLRKCAKFILHPNNVTANKTDRLCQFRGKICSSLAGLKSHLRTHKIYGGVGVEERTWDKGGGHARNREDSHHIYIYIYIYRTIKLQMNNTGELFM